MKAQILIAAAALAACPTVAFAWEAQSEIYDTRAECQKALADQKRMNRDANGDAQMFCYYEPELDGWQIRVQPFYIPEPHGRY